MAARERHTQAGQTVTVKKGPFAGQEYHIEGWWINVAGKSWMMCDGNPACMNYGMRAGFGNLPVDNEVLYGKIGALGYLIHTSELSE